MKRTHLAIAILLLCGLISVISYIHFSILRESKTLNTNLRKSKKCRPIFSQDCKIKCGSHNFEINTNKNGCSYCRCTKKPFSVPPTFKPINQMSDEELIKVCTRGTPNDHFDTSKRCDADNTPPNPLDRVIVVAKYKEDTDRWLKYIPEIPHIIYDKEHHPILKVNKGQEAHTYLRYIIDNYDNLPQEVIFLHGHGPNPHQWHLIEMIKTLKVEKRYRSLNHVFWHHMDIVNPVSLGIICKMWLGLFEPELGPMPPKFTDVCCAQFVVHRCVILSHPKSFYQKYYDFLEHTDMPNSASSRAAEYTWGYIFGRSWSAGPEGYFLADIVNIVEYRKLTQPGVYNDSYFQMLSRDGFYLKAHPEVLEEEWRIKNGY